MGEAGMTTITVQYPGGKRLNFREDEGQSLKIRWRNDVAYIVDGPEEEVIAVFPLGMISGIYEDDYTIG